MKLRSKKDGTIITVPSELEDQVRAIIKAGGDPTKLLQDAQMNYGGYMAEGGINNPGFRALPEEVQQNIIDNMNYGGYMASGGCMECGGMMESGGKMPQWLAEARFPDKSKLEEYGYKPVDQAGDGKWIQKVTKSIKKRGTEGVCTGSKFGGPSCPPGSKRYNLAKTFRKMANSRKDDGGYLPMYQNAGYLTLGKDKSGSVVTMDKSGNITYMNPNAVTPMQTFAANTMPEYQDPYFSQNKLETEPKQKTTPRFRFTGFDLAPLSGGPYAQRGVNYLSRAMNQIPGVVEYSRTGKMSPENLAPFYNTTPYGMFISNPEIDYKNVEPYYTKKGKLRYRAEGGYLPMAQNSLNPQLINQQDDFDFSTQGLARPNLTVASNQYIADQNQEMSLNRPDLQGDLNQQLSVSEKLDVPKLPGENQRKFNRAVKKYSKGLVQASPAINAIAAGYQFGKQGLSDIADKMSNDQAQLAYSQMYGSQKYSDAIAGPYQIYGKNWEGENALPATAYGGYAADGMQIRQIGGMGEPNVEVEGREHIKLPNGFSQEIQGKSHAQGGIPLNLPQGTQIFSEKLKDPETGKSYADLAKKFETKKYVDLLNSKSADSIQKTTAEMMIKQNTAKLEELFALQEENKLSGAHGAKVQQKAMQEQQQAMAQQQAEMQSQMQGEEMQEQPMEEPMMMHGGYHLPKFQNAGNQNEPQEEESNYFGFSGIGDYFGDVAKNLKNKPYSPITFGPAITLNMAKAMSSPEYKKSVKKIIHPSKSSGVIDYAGNLLSYPLSSVNASLTGNFGSTGNFWTDLGMDPLSYVGVREAKLLGKGIYNEAKPFIKDLPQKWEDVKYLAEVLKKAGPGVIKLIGKEGVKQIQKVAPKILKNPAAQNLLTSGAVKARAGYQREEEKNRQIKQLKAALKEKEKPIERPSMQYTAPSENMTNYQGIRTVKSNEDFKYGGYLPMYSEAGETKGKEIDYYETNKDNTKIRPVYKDGTKGKPIPRPQYINPFATAPLSIDQYVQQAPVTNRPSRSTPPAQRKAVANQQAAQMAMQQQAPYAIPPGQAFPPYGGINIKPVGFMTPSGPITEETGFNIQNAPTWAQRDLTEWDRAYGFEPGYIQSLATDPKASNITDRYAALPGKDPVAGLYQEYMYDYHLDRLNPKQNFSPEEREASRKALQQMWQPTGSTRYGLSKGVKGKGIDFDKAGYEEYANLRPSFIDAVGQYRYLEPGKQPVKPAEVKKAEEKKGETITPPAPGKETITKYVRPEVGVDMALGIPLPQVYGRNPLNYYKIEPQFVEAPVEQPYVNDIVRAMRANITNATDLSGSGLANRQAALATGIGEMGRRYQEATTRNLENRFRADLANAQAKAQTDQFNQQSFMRDYEIPIREREARIDSQIRLDAEKALENERRFRAYQQNKDIAQSFYPFMNMSGDQLAATMPYINRYLQDQGYDIKEKKKKKSKKETTTPSINQNSADSQIAFSKYGGKLKIKPKLKGKFRK